MQYSCWNSCLFVNGVEIYKFKEKDSEINAALLCLRNVSKIYSTNNMKRTELCEYVYGFSVNYDSIDVDYILDIHKYLMKKHNIKNCLLDY